jgi:hypothetical protein
MKTITVNVSEIIYQLFQGFGKRRGRTTAELIREAMEHYAKSQIENRANLLDLPPLYSGTPNKGAFEIDDLMSEMIDGD